MFKYIFLLGLVSAAFHCAAKDTTAIKQTTNATLQLTYPAVVKAGNQPELLITIKNKLAVEWTGYLQLVIKNTGNGEIVDGIFGNVFPNQYFTVSSRQSATLAFPLNIPYHFTTPVLLSFTLHKADTTDSLVTILRIH